MREKKRKSNYHDRIKRAKQTFVFIVASIVAMLVIAGLTGCSNKKYIYVTDTIHTTDTLRLTQYQRDSVYVDRIHNVYIKGDTIIIKDSVWLSRYITKHDTIEKVAEVKKVVYIPMEKKADRKPLTPVYCVLFIGFVVAILLTIKKYMKR